MQNPVRKIDIGNFFVISARMSILSATLELYRQDFKYISENQIISTFAKFSIQKRTHPSWASPVIHLCMVETVGIEPTSKDIGT